jgi:HAMP domain-containing protein
MMTVLPTLIALCLIVTCTLFIAITVQRALTRTAILRHGLRAGGPFHMIRYSISDPAWPLPSPLPNLRKGAERATRLVTKRNVAPQHDSAEAA